MIIKERKEIERIRDLLHVGGNFFYINFNLDEINSLRDCIMNGAGFRLNTVYKHPNKNKSDTFVLEIEGINPKNKQMNINLLCKFHRMNNKKKVSPNLLEEISIENFEQLHGFLGRPKLVAKKKVIKYSFFLTRE